MIKPDHFPDFTPEQVKWLTMLNHIGNNGWARNSYSDLMVPATLRNLEEARLTFVEIAEAMLAIGHGKREGHSLERYERKRTTGKFGR